MSDLKPCPCCNSQAVYNKAKELGANGEIHCPVCGLSLDGFHFDNDELMLKAWNRRPDTPAAPLTQPSTPSNADETK